MILSVAVKVVEAALTVVVWTHNKIFRPKADPWQVVFTEDDVP